MRVSLDWLREYVEISDTVESLAERLTMAGLEVESIDRPGDRFKGFVVGRVVEVRRHPNADRLTVCRVDTGPETVQIVCGAPNVAAGQRVAVGLSGAVVPRNQHDPAGGGFTLSTVKIRGVESSGMICSEYELGLGDDKDGILVLPQTAPVGRPLAQQLGFRDACLEIGITPNRPDAMSHVGVARELAAIYGKRLRLPAVRLKEAKEPVGKHLAVNILDRKACPRYVARVVTDILVGPSPDWLKARLELVGLRPVNNIVDATNFVLMEIGHPLHAFDYDAVRGKTINVRPSQAGQLFRTLDHKARELAGGTLLIADAEDPIAIAGIMGGENSEIRESTRNVVIESAYFEPTGIRRSSKHLGLSTDASQRFERGADPNVALWAAERAAELIQRLAGGRILRGAIDVYPEKIRQKTVSVRTSRVNDVLGVHLDDRAITLCLKKIGISAAAEKKKRAGDQKFVVPTFRPDLEREIDLIEEVARIHGYEKIPTVLHAAIGLPQTPEPRDETAALREVLVGMGFREVVSSSMQELETARLTSGHPVAIINPVSREMSALRTSLIPNLLGIIRENIFHGTKDLRLLEIGSVYEMGRPGAEGKYFKDFLEDERLILAMSGSGTPPHWQQPLREIDVFDMKGAVESLARKISLDKIQFIPYSTTDSLTEAGLAVEINGKAAGFLAEVSKAALARFEIEQKVIVCDLAVEALTATKGRERKFKPLAKYPPVLRDLAFVVDRSVPAEGMIRHMKGCGALLLSSVDVFDVYEGDQIGSGKKSVAFSLQFSSFERTLEQGEVDAEVDRIVKHLAKSFEATLRA